MNEEKKTCVESITCMEDAYQLACKSGFTGERKDFAQLCVNAAEGMDKLDLDDMENIAGGNAVTEAAENVWEWCRENPALAIGIGAAATAAIGGAVAYGVHTYKKSKGAGYDPNVKLNTTENLVLSEFHDPSKTEEYWAFWKHPGEPTIYQIYSAIDK